METFLATLLLPSALLLAGVRRVPEDTALTVRRFGRRLRVLTPGLRFTWPMLDKVTQRIRLIGHHVDVPLDGNTSTHAEVHYQILQPERTGAALEEVDALVERQASETLASLPSVDASDATALAQSLKHELNRELAALGLRVTRCAVRPDANA